MEQPELQPEIHPLTQWLLNRKPWQFTLWVGAMAFLVYACMYGLRRPYTVGEFQELSFLGMNYKSLLIISQVCGYALSKFIGITVISEMGRPFRAITILFLTGIAQIVLVFFAIIPAPYNLFVMFFNGLPLGMIWGLVFSYLEGRRTTEVLGTMLSVSFIVSSGFVKSAGSMVLDVFGVSEFQMPWITGLIFYIPMIFLVWLLDKTPDPSPEDELLRTKRVPMDSAMRKKIFFQFAPGLIALTLAYVFLTVFRDLRDNFAAEIFSSIGIGGNSMIFTWSEIPIAVTVFVIMASLMLVKNNRKAFMINHIIIATGFLMVGLSTLALRMEMISPLAWMILLGLGTYMGYLPFNSFLFDRLIAAFGSAANAGFFIYIADSFGYLGTVGTLFYQNFGAREFSWMDFLMDGSYALSMAGGAMIIFSLFYFNRKINKKESAEF
ncbi:MAG: hypothetical protein EA361_01875 [Bacteroidetes bacterium]|nr:MAG: hypothetical protein EA361_01875 [Bacteroidota bacterium]